MMLAVLFAVVAVATADQTLRVNGREFRVHDAKKTYNQAQAACAASGTVLATICSEEELNTFRSAGYSAPVTTEYWIGLPSNLNHHSLISADKFATMTSGSRCRIMSNWASRPWNVFTKECDQGTRPYICEVDDAGTCPEFFNVNGHEFSFHKAKKSYTAAKAACEADGQVLATICNQQELDAIRATGFTAPVTTELWIGLPSSQNHHSMIQPAQFAVMNTGDRCRILSNWGSKPWNIFTKDCDQGQRFYICEAGEKMDKCPAPKPEPLIEVLPEVKPEAPVQIPEVAAPAPIPEVAAPAPIPEVAAPAPIPEVAAPAPAPVDPAPIPEPETCTKQRVAFKANGLPVEPSFEKDSCLYLAKQCNDEKCYCVSPKKGVRKYGKLEVPLGQDFDCSSKARKCHAKLFSILIKQAAGKTVDYIPTCTKRGQFDKKQCDESGACWCAKKLGREIKKTRNADGNAVKC